jgi:hypothetical protein
MVGTIRAAMRLEFALLFPVVVALPAAAAPAANADVASKALEKARASLSELVKRIEVDPPAMADLDAAHAAVNALKQAIDDGAAFEADNLDYARAALAARKELRTHREYVDERRGKVKVHEQRRLVDAALATLRERAKRVEDKDPAAKDFDAARAAAKELRKALADSKPFAGQDAKFAAYLKDTEATLDKTEKAIDDRWVLLSADKHKAQVEDARKALTAALGALGKGATDAQFKEADEAIAALSKLLEDGKALEAGEKGYRAYAEQSRAEVARAKKQMDAAWTETGLERLKAEIEPAYKDLLAAGKPVKAKKPTAEQLAEARTAAIVVSKLLEKFKAEAERSQAFGQYVKEVRAALVEVEVQLQLRALDAATADVKQSLRPLERKAPTDEQFDVAKSALLVLEKTLETVHAKDPVMAPYAFDARKLLKDAREVVTRRRVEVDVEAQKARVEAARKVVGDLLAKPSLTGEELDDAERGVEHISAALDAGGDLSKQSRDYAVYEREVRKRVGELQGKIAARRLALTVSETRSKLSEAVAQGKQRIEAARQPVATDADLEAAQAAVQAVEQLLEANAELEKKNGGYAAQAERVRYEQLVRLMESFEATRQLRELRKKTGDALAAGESAVAAAEAARDLRTKKKEYERALAEFTACKDETRRVTATPALEKTVVVVDGRTTTAKEVVTTCAQRAEATAQAIKPLAALIAFEDGPKKHYEAARRLASQGKKADAAAQFDECMTSGLILQNRNPQMKDQPLDVGTGTMTLGELIKQCSADAKANRGK